MRLSPNRRFSRVVLLAGLLLPLSSACAGTLQTFTFNLTVTGIPGQTTGWVTTTLSPDGTQANGVNLIQVGFLLSALPTTQMNYVVSPSSPNFTSLNAILQQNNVGTNGTLSLGGSLWNSSSAGPFFTGQRDRATALTGARSSYQGYTITEIDIALSNFSLGPISGQSFQASEVITIQGFANTPEPATAGLAALALAGLTARKRRNSLRR